MMIGQTTNSYSNRGPGGNRRPGGNRGPGGSRGPSGNRGPGGSRGPGGNRGPRGPRGDSANSLGGRMRSDRARGQNPTANLTSEQRAEVQALRQEAQADGTVTGEERRAIGDTLRSYRQEANSSNSTSAEAQTGPFGAGGPFANLDLSDSQRSEISSLATAAKSDGQFTHEDRESIHQAVESMVGHSIPRPQGPPGGSPQGGVGSNQFGGNSFGNFPLGQTNSTFPGTQQFQTSMSQLQQLFQGFLGGY